MVAPKLISGRKRKTFSKSFKPIVLLPKLEPPPEEPPEMLFLTNCGGENCCVETVAIVFVAPVLSKLIPKLVNFARST